MLEFAYGNMGMTPMELAQFTPYQLNLKYNGYIKKQDVEEMYFRKLARLLITPHLDTKKKVELSDIWPTHYDKAADIEEGILTKKNMDSALEAWKNRKNKAIN